MPGPNNLTTFILSFIIWPGLIYSSVYTYIGITIVILYTIALVYLSLGSTNITTNNTEILITHIGNNTGALPYLSCHTDQTNLISTGMGEWYYPNGSVIQELEAAGESFYRGRHDQTVNLHRRQELNPLSPTGSFCCVVPSALGEQTFCVNIGIHV